MQDPTEFRQRFQLYKEGKMPYENGLPKYATGTEGWLPDYTMDYILALENPTRQGFSNGIWRPPTDSSKWDTNAIGGGLDIRYENNPLVYNFLSKNGRLNDPYLTEQEETDLRWQIFNRDMLPILSKVHDKYGEQISPKGYARLAGMKWQGHPFLMAITPDSITGKAFLNAIASGDKDLDSVFDTYYLYPSNAKKYASRIQSDKNYWEDIKPERVKYDIPTPEIKPHVEVPDRTAVRKTIPKSKTKARWSGAEEVSPYLTGRPILKLQKKTELPTVVEENKKLQWKAPIQFKDGKLPRYEDGTMATALLKGGASFVPGVGTAIDAYDLYKEPSLDNLGYLILSGIGDAAMFTGFGGPLGLTLKNIRNAAKLNKARKTVKALSETRKANDAIQLYEAKKAYNQSKAAATALAAETGNIMDTASEVLQGYKNGKSPIHINPANRGKFNATKKRTGKTTEQLAHSSNPLTRKRAIFALNSKKWSH